MGNYPTHGEARERSVNFDVSVRTAGRALRSLQLLKTYPVSPQVIHSVREDLERACVGKDPDSEQALLFRCPLTVAAALCPLVDELEHIGLDSEALTEIRDLFGMITETASRTVPVHPYTVLDIRYREGQRRSGSTKQKEAQSRLLILTPYSFYFDHRGKPLGKTPAYRLEHLTDLLVPEEDIPELSFRFLDEKGKDRFVTVGSQGIMAREQLLQALCLLSRDCRARREGRAGDKKVKVKKVEMEEEVGLQDLMKSRLRFSNDTRIVDTMVQADMQLGSIQKSDEFLMKRAQLLYDQGDYQLARQDLNGCIVLSNVAQTAAGATPTKDVFQQRYSYYSLRSQCYLNDKFVPPASRVHTIQQFHHILENFWADGMKGRKLVDEDLDPLHQQAHFLLQHVDPHFDPTNYLPTLLRVHARYQMVAKRKRALEKQRGKLKTLDAEDSAMSSTDLAVELTVVNQSISTFELIGLEQFGNLKYLNMDNNRVKCFNFHVLSNGCPKLESLYLESNGAAFIEGALNLPHLKSLSMANNEFEKLSDVMHACEPVMDNLKSLTLIGNPFTSVFETEDIEQICSRYRYQVVRSFSSLEELDEVIVTPIERMEASLFLSLEDLCAVLLMLLSEDLFVQSSALTCLELHLGDPMMRLGVVKYGGVRLLLRVMRFSTSPLIHLRAARVLGWILSSSILFDDLNFDGHVRTAASVGSHSAFFVPFDRKKFFCDFGEMTGLQTLIFTLFRAVFRRTKLRIHENQVLNDGQIRTRSAKLISPERNRELILALLASLIAVCVPRSNDFPTRYDFTELKIEQAREETEPDPKQEQDETNQFIANTLLFADYITIPLGSEDFSECVYPDESHEDNAQDEEIQICGVELLARILHKENEHFAKDRALRKKIEKAKLKQKAENRDSKASVPARVKKAAVAATHTSSPESVADDMSIQAAKDKKDKKKDKEKKKAEAKQKALAEKKKVKEKKQKGKEKEPPRPAFAPQPRPEPEEEREERLRRLKAFEERERQREIEKERDAEQKKETGEAAAETAAAQPEEPEEEMDDGFDVALAEQSLSALGSSLSFHCFVLLLALLQNRSVVRNDPKLEERRRLFVDEGGVEAILKVFEFYPDDSRIIMHGTLVLLSLLQSVRAVPEKYLISIPTIQKMYGLLKIPTPVESAEPSASTRRGVVSGSSSPSSPYTPPESPVTPKTPQIIGQKGLFLVGVAGSQSSQNSPEKAHAGRSSSELVREMEAKNARLDHVIDVFMDEVVLLILLAVLENEPTVLANTAGLLVDHPEQPGGKLSVLDKLVLLWGCDDENVRGLVTRMIVVFCQNVPGLDKQVSEGVRFETVLGVISARDYPMLPAISLKHVETPPVYLRSSPCANILDSIIVEALSAEGKLDVLYWLGGDGSADAESRRVLETRRIVLDTLIRMCSAGQTLSMAGRAMGVLVSYLEHDNCVSSVPSSPSGPAPPVDPNCFTLGVARSFRTVFQPAASLLQSSSEQVVQSSLSFLCTFFGRMNDLRRLEEDAALKQKRKTQAMLVESGDLERVKKMAVAHAKKQAAPMAIRPPQPSGGTRTAPKHMHPLMRRRGQAAAPSQPATQTKTEFQGTAKDVLQNTVFPLLGVFGLFPALVQLVERYVNDSSVHPFFIQSLSSKVHVVERSEAGDGDADGSSGTGEAGGPARRRLVADARGSFLNVRGSVRLSHSMASQPPASRKEREFAQANVDYALRLAVVLSSLHPATVESHFRRCPNDLIPFFRFLPLLPEVMTVVPSEEMLKAQVIRAHAVSALRVLMVGTSRMYGVPSQVPSVPEAEDHSLYDYHGGASFPFSVAPLLSYLKVLFEERQSQGGRELGVTVPPLPGESESAAAVSRVAHEVEFIILRLLFHLCLNCSQELTKDVISEFLPMECCAGAYGCCQQFSTASGIDIILPYILEKKRNFHVMTLLLDFVFAPPRPGFSSAAAAKLANVSVDQLFSLLELVLNGLQVAAAPSGRRVLVYWGVLRGSGPKQVAHYYRAIAALAHAVRSLLEQEKFSFSALTASQNAALSQLLVLPTLTVQIVPAAQQEIVADGQAARPQQQSIREMTSGGDNMEEAVMFALSVFLEQKIALLGAVTSRLKDDEERTAFGRQRHMYYDSILEFLKQVEQSVSEEDGSDLCKDFHRLKELLLDVLKDLAVGSNGADAGDSSSIMDGIEGLSDEETLAVRFAYRQAFVRHPLMQKEQTGVERQQSQAATFATLLRVFASKDECLEQLQARAAAAVSLKVLLRENPWLGDELVAEDCVALKWLWDSLEVPDAFQLMQETAGEKPLNFGVPVFKPVADVEEKLRLELLESLLVILSIAVENERVSTLKSLPGEKAAIPQIRAFLGQPDVFARLVALSSVSPGDTIGEIRPVWSGLPDLSIQTGFRIQHFAVLVCVLVLRERQDDLDDLTVLCAKEVGIVGLMEQNLRAYAQLYTVLGARAVQAQLQAEADAAEVVAMMETDDQTEVDGEVEEDEGANWLKENLEAHRSLVLCTEALEICAEEGSLKIEAGTSPVVAVLLDLLKSLKPEGTSGTLSLFRAVRFRGQATGGEIQFLRALAISVVDLRLRENSSLLELFVAKDGVKMCCHILKAKRMLSSTTVEYAGRLLMRVLALDADHMKRAPEIPAVRVSFPRRAGVRMPHVKAQGAKSRPQVPKAPKPEVPKAPKPSLKSSPRRRFSAVDLLLVEDFIGLLVATLSDNLLVEKCVGRSLPLVSLLGGPDEEDLFDEIGLRLYSQIPDDFLSFESFGFLLRQFLKARSAVEADVGDSDVVSARQLYAVLLVFLKVRSGSQKGIIDSSAARTLRSRRFLKSVVSDVCGLFLPHLPTKASGLTGTHTQAVALRMLYHLACHDVAQRFLVEERRLFDAVRSTLSFLSAMIPVTAYRVYASQDSSETRSSLTGKTFPALPRLPVPVPGQVGQVMGSLSEMTICLCLASLCKIVRGVARGRYRELEDEDEVSGVRSLSAHLRSSNLPSVIVREILALSTSTLIISQSLWCLAAIGSVRDPVLSAYLTDGCDLLSVGLALLPSTKRHPPGAAFSRPRVASRGSSSSFPSESGAAKRRLSAAKRSSSVATGLSDLAGGRDSSFASRGSRTKERAEMLFMASSHCMPESPVEPEGLKTPVRKRTKSFVVTEKEKQRNHLSLPREVLELEFSTPEEYCESILGLYASLCEVETRFCELFLAKFLDHSLYMELVALVGITGSSSSALGGRQLSLPSSLNLLDRETTDGTDSRTRRPLRIVECVCVILERCIMTEMPKPEVTALRGFPSLIDEYAFMSSSETSRSSFVFSRFPSALVLLVQNIHAPLKLDPDAPASQRAILAALRLFIILQDSSSYASKSEKRTMKELFLDEGVLDTLTILVTARVEAFVTLALQALGAFIAGFEQGVRIFSEGGRLELLTGLVPSPHKGDVAQFDGLLILLHALSFGGTTCRAFAPGGSPSKMLISALVQALGEIDGKRGGRRVVLRGVTAQEVRSVQVDWRRPEIEGLPDNEDVCSAVDDVEEMGEQMDWGIICENAAKDGLDRDEVSEVDDSSSDLSRGRAESSTSTASTGSLRGKIDVDVTLLTPTGHAQRMVVAGPVILDLLCRLVEKDDSDGWRSWFLVQLSENSAFPLLSKWLMRSMALSESSSRGHRVSSVSDAVDERDEDIHVREALVSLYRFRIVLLLVALVRRCGDRGLHLVREWFVYGGKPAPSRESEEEERIQIEQKRLGILRAKLKWKKDLSDEQLKQELATLEGPCLIPSVRSSILHNVLRHEKVASDGPLQEALRDLMKACGYEAETSSEREARLAKRSALVRQREGERKKFDEDQRKQREAIDDADDFLKDAEAEKLIWEARWEEDSL